MARSLTMLNESGDTTISWTEDLDDQIEEIVRKKMDEGCAFFIIERDNNGVRADQGALDRRDVRGRYRSPQFPRLPSRRSDAAMTKYFDDQPIVKGADVIGTDARRVKRAPPSSPNGKSGTICISRFEGGKSPIRVQEYCRYKIPDECRRISTLGRSKIQGPIIMSTRCGFRSIIEGRYLP